MPGGSFCCVVGCSTCSMRCRGLSFHGIPKEGHSEEQNLWRKKLIVSINRADHGFNPLKAKICSRHFTEDCFKTQYSGRKTLKVGSLPSRFMPAKSVETPKPKPRKPPKERCDPCPAHNDEAQESVEPESSACPGITDEKLQCYANIPPRDSSESHAGYYLHVEYHKSGNITTCTTTVRAQSCTGYTIGSANEPCSGCLYAKRLILRKHVRKTIAEKMEIRRCCPLSKVSKARVANALKVTRLEKSMAIKQLAEIKKQLSSESITVSDLSHQRLHNIIGQHEFEENSFIAKFWEEQKKAFTLKPGGMRWHPMMIKFAILLHSQSPAAYRSLRDIGVLRLPAESTLRDYTNYIHPKSGFQLEVFEELKNMAENFEENQRFVSLLHDEILIKSGLVYDHRSGEVVGFIDEGQRDQKSAQDSHLATHALVFMVVGISSKIKMSIGYFPTRTATADEIFPLLWTAVGLLENVSNLKVIASTSDKASQNQKLIRLHGSIYKAKNLFAERDLFFFSDAPHLIKTVRNNLASSGWGKKTKRLWNNGSELLWGHIAHVYNEDSERQLRRTRLTSEHIHLSPQSTMRVYLAAQVLSHSVGRVMQVFGSPDCQETAKFILLMDKFFDCLNVRSITEGREKANIYLHPYRDCEDDRFRFLAEDFLGYLEDWQTAVMGRDGFTKTEKNKMFLSYQTYEGLKTTVYSMIEATKYLLQSGVQMVLTNKFCQDPLEAHFGRHRCIGIRAENPTLWTFGYQENKLRVQRNLSLAIQPRGNVRGSKRKRGVLHVQVDNTPMAKISRKH